MVDIRKIIIIFVVGILFSVLVFSTIEAIYPHPEYDDFCTNDRYPIKSIGAREDLEDCPEVIPSEAEVESCDAQEGYINFEYDSKGCEKSYYCETCSKEFDDQMDVYRRYVFYISAVLSLIAIFLGLYLPANANTLNEWIGTGFMLGGTFALFFGTMSSFSSLDRFVRPIVIFLELVLVIFIAYRKIGNFRETKNNGSASKKAKSKKPKARKR